VTAKCTCKVLAAVAGGIAAFSATAFANPVGQELTRNNDATRAAAPDISIKWAHKGTPVRANAIELGDRGVGNDTCAGAESLACGSSVTFDNTGAAPGWDGALGTCFVGADQTNSVWYTFNATENSATVGTCNSASTDSAFLIYSGSCAALTTIGCSDDGGCPAGGFLGQTSVFGLTVGADYFIQVGSWDAASVGSYTLDLACTDSGTGAANDFCDGAVSFTCGDSVTADLTTALPGWDGALGGCFVGAGQTNSLWFSFAATDTAATLSTCASTSTDSAFLVYSGSCAALTTIGCSDDGGCDTLPFLGSTTILGLTAGDTYFVQIGAWNAAAVGVYQLDSECFSLGACAECPAGANIECEFGLIGDGYDDLINGGCNSGNPPITCDTLSLPSDTWCGTSGTHLNGAGGQVRDTDWYDLSLTSTTDLTLGIDAKFPWVLFVINNDGGADPCATAAVLESATGDLCSPGTLEVTLAAGNYWVFVAPSVFTGVPFNAEYTLTVDVVTGLTQACCFLDGSCQDLNAVDCTTAGGFAQGSGTTCADGLCCAPGDANSIAEGEPACFDGYNDQFNGGCFSTCQCFITILPGETYLGTSGIYTNQDGILVRDTDWYLLDIVADGDLVVCVQSQYFAADVVFEDNGDGSVVCGNTQLGAVTTDPCVLTEITVTGVTAGSQWYVWVGATSIDDQCGDPGVAPVYTFSYGVCDAGPVCDPTCGDVTGDGNVDLADLNLVLGNFGTSPGVGLNGDANCDGNVDLGDLNLVLGQFGGNC
jgi:hypothetical protein